jgi:hypothetical protein
MAPPTISQSCDDSWAVPSVDSDARRDQISAVKALMNDTYVSFASPDIA